MYSRCKEICNYFFLDGFTPQDILEPIFNNLTICVLNCRFSFHRHSYLSPYRLGMENFLLLTNEFAAILSFLLFSPLHIPASPHSSWEKWSTQCTGSVSERKIKSKFLSSMSAFMSFFKQRIISAGTRAAGTDGRRRCEQWGSKVPDEEGFYLAPASFVWNCFGHEIKSDATV